MAPSPAEKALQQLLNKISPIFNNYLNTFRRLRQFSFTVLVIVFVITIAISLVTPFKLFPRQKSILQLKKDYLARAIKNALKTTPATPKLNKADYSIIKLEK